MKKETKQRVISITNVLIKLLVANIAAIILSSLYISHLETELSFVDILFKMTVYYGILSYLVVAGLFIITDIKSK